MDNKTRKLALQIACLSAYHVTGAARRQAEIDRSAREERICRWTPAEIDERSREEAGNATNS